MNRRNFLKIGAAAGAALIGPGKRLLLAASPNLAKFVDPLPKAPFLRGTKLQVTMSQLTQKLHRDLPPTTLWGYNGIYPGPTIEATRGTPTTVKWVNNLPTTHMFPVDHTIHGAENVPDVRTVVHLHGVKVLPGADGYPDAWFTSTGVTGPAYMGNAYTYPNDQQGTTLWYHDHALGITRLNVQAGLAGMYLIRDSEDLNPLLPQGDYEVPLFIQDHSFNADGSLYFPVNTNPASTHPLWMPEFFGDVPVVNGKAWPFQNVEPRSYRYRIVNGCNARFLNMWFDANGSPMTVYQIGTDGGLLPRPVALTKLLIAPGERADLVVNFAGLAPGTPVTLMNNAKAPFPGGAGGFPQIMQFRVGSKVSKADSFSPSLQLTADIQPLQPTPGAPVRQITLEEYEDMATGEPLMGVLDARDWNQPVNQNPKAGSTEIWEFVNTTGDTHPIHMHLVQFQILDRQPFNAAAYSSSVIMGTSDRPPVGPYLTGAPVPPDANEAGWKDTVRTNPGEVTRVIARFDLPTGTRVQSGKPYRYVFHCHILDHEDNEMMRPYDVIG